MRLLATVAGIVLVALTLWDVFSIMVLTRRANRQLQLSSFVVYRLRKVYIAAGISLIWLVDPESRTVTVYAGRLRGLELDETDQLDGGDVLPGFACKVGDLFPPARS